MTGSDLKIAPCGVFRIILDTKAAGGSPVIVTLSIIVVPKSETKKLKKNFVLKTGW